VQQIRKRLTYANVMSSISVFLILGGATAFAATKIGSNEIKSNAITTGKIKKEAVARAKIKNAAVDASKLADNAVTNAKIADNAVTTGKLADNAVTNAKIADNAVTNGKLANDAVTGTKVADGSLTGADINQSSLTSVKAANVFSALFEATGSKIARASGPGIVSGGCFLVCRVEFPRDVTECVFSATTADNGNGSGVPAIAEAFNSSDPKSVLVAMFNDEGTLISHDFALTVICPTA
jgi:hypothetical protein